MKKLLSVLLILMIATTVAFAFDMSRFSLGASFGTSGSSEKSSNPVYAGSVNSGKFGYVVRLRADYSFAEDQSATLMISFDSPSKTVLMKTYLMSNEDLKDPKYLKFFIGYTRHSVTEQLLIAYGVGPEISIDLANKVVGAGAATYVRTSYLLPGSNLTFDSTAKGSVEWIKDMPDNNTHFYLDGDVSLGFTYHFHPTEYVYQYRYR